MKPEELGFRIVMTPKTLGRSGPAPDTVFATLASIPRKGAVFAISRVAQMLELRGQTDLKVQRGLVDANLRNSSAKRRIHNRLSAGETFATYSGLHALIRLAMGHCSVEDADLTPSQRHQLFSLIPSVNQFIVGGHLLRGEPSPEQRRGVALLSSFLGANMDVAGDPQLGMLLDWSFGASIAKHAWSDEQRMKRLNAKVSAVTGRTLPELYVMTALLFSNFIASNDGAYADVKSPPRRLVPVDAKPLDLRGLADHLTAAAEELGQLTLEEACTPRTSWPDAINWRPFFHTSDWMVCWDVVMSRRLLSFNFPELVRRVAPDAHGGVDDLWNAGVELALQDAFELYVGPDSVTRLTSGSMAPPVEGETAKIAEWFVVDGDDLFVFEWKNLKLAQSTFSMPSPEYYETWLRQKLSEKQGFTQVYNSISRARRGWKTSSGEEGRPLTEFKRIWPVVMSPFHLPADVLGAALLEGFVSGHAAPLREAGLPIQEPLAFHPWELLPLFATEGQSAGQLLERWRTDGGRRTPLPTAGLVRAGVEVSDLGLLVREAGKALEDLLETRLVGLEPD